MRVRGLDLPNTVLIARQPILDTASRLSAYELLYRSARSGPVDGDAATAAVAVHALLNIGLDRLVGSAVAFVNIPARVLTARLYEFLPPERAVLEILEDVDASDAVLDEVRRARSLGYRIALDDFEPRPGNAALVELADVIKFDVLATPKERVAAFLETLPGRRPTLLAEKVETRAVFDAYAALGFELFQGHYFARPEIVAGRRAPERRVLMLRLVAKLQDPDVQVEDVEALVQTDVGLTYKLLRYANSALVAPARPISSVRDAVLMLGLDRLRLYASMMLLSGSDDKPHELVLTALLRARYCELMAEATHTGNGRECFTAGLLSVLDAFVDQPLEQVLSELRVAPALHEALLTHQGPMGTLLEGAIACEHADFDRMLVAGVSPEVQRDAYVRALDWARESMAALNG